MIMRRMIKNNTEVTKTIKKIYCIICSKHRKFEKLKKHHTS